MPAPNWQYLEDKSYKMGQWLSNPPPGEDVVITGIAGKFPESDDVYQFEDKLFKKVDLISEDKRRRKLNTSKAPLSTGKLNDISAFDAGFFGIPSRRANNMDVCMRMILERTYEAIMDAGYHASELAGTKTGVFISSNFSDCENYILYDKHDGNSQSLLGSTCSMQAHHISYFFQFQGPSCILDSGCSASMYALEHAYRSIRKGICDMAVVGGVNLCLHPNITMHFARAGVLSPEGRCKTFDNNANGYVRSEAIVAILLQKSKDARRMYARVLHTKLNADGYKQQGIMHPSSEIQIELMRETYAECNVDLSDVNFVEAHGTGTKVGDPQELNAIADVFCSERDGPLYIGAVKSNAGHTEPVGALVSIIKVLLAMERGFIPPNINYSKPREGVDALAKGFLKVITEKTAWPNSKGIIAGVNSFGIGGANGHAVLRRNGKQKTNSGTPEDDLPRLVCASGRTKEALNAIWDDLGSRPLDAEFVCLLHKVFEKRTLDHPFRGYQILGKVGELKRSVNAVSGDKRKLAWVFSNFDSNWPKVGKELVAFPVFAETLKKVQTVGNFNVHIIEILETFGRETTTNQVLATMATQICLASALNAVGLIPDAIIGLGTGELIVAYLEDQLTLDELCAHFFGDNVNPPVCRKYFARNRVGPLGLAEVKKLLLSNCDVLVIGGQIRNYEHLSLIREDSRDYVLDLLTTLGRFYEKGHDLWLNNLYAKVTWPVSRGTPMISPLIKWDYSRRWRVPYQGDELRARCRQHTVQIDVKSKDWNFITGHVVDGRNLFPATGLLYIAWETLADMNDKTISETKVVFENVRFVQAVNLTNQDVVQLTVSILDGSKTFEISERGALIMKGAVYEVPDTNLPQPPVEDLEGNVSLKKAEIYRALRLRGYNYKGQFKGIECEVGKENGLIKWTGNWITFMDNVLQMFGLYVENRSLYIPTSIKHIIIDPTVHLEVAAGRELIPVRAHYDLGIVRSGGVEFRGMKGSPISRRKDKEEPVLDVHKFIANATTLSLEESVRVMVQIILENSRSIKFKSVEVAGASPQLISPLMNRALNDLLLIQAELIVLSKESPNLPGITFEDRKLDVEDNSLVVVLSYALEETRSIKFQMLEEAIRTVKGNNGYVLTRERLGFDGLREVPDALEVLCVHTTDSETLLLLRKSTAKEKPTVINVSNDLEWLTEAQEEFKRHRPLILYSQNRSSDGILGLTNCLRKEPAGGGLSCFFIVDEAPEFDPNHPFYRKQIQKNMTTNVWKDGRWGTYRHLLLKQNASIPCEYCYAYATVQGELSSIKFIQGNPHMTKEMQTIYVYWSALNFKDVLTASGKISGDTASRNPANRDYVLGLEFSGRDVTGRRVMGLTTGGALATHVITDSLMIWKVPDDWSLEDAATVPSVYVTVTYALLMRGGMKHGQSILIHSGTGGIGQAAINIALHFGCTVFVTVGAQEKKDFLLKNYPQIEEHNVGNSRDTSFEQMVLLRTNGRGVDFVLNSLAEDKLRASVRCLARNGVFLEIGKFDIEQDNELEMGFLGKGASFRSVMLDFMFTYGGKPELKSKLHRYFGDLLRQGVIKPLPRTTFKKEEVADAFKFMATGKHIGKILVSIREEEEEELICLPKLKVFSGFPRYYCNPRASYIIIGGLGGFGLELVGWLIMRGARKIILSSRTGVKTGYQEMMLRTWRAYDADISVRTDDVTTKEGCIDLITYANSRGPVKAIFNLALVLNDGLFENQSVESFEYTLAPKALGTQNLDTISRKMCPQLSDFVAFSSTCCGRGNVEQSNYGMANSVMERICEKRKEEGFPALAIQWGTIGDVGVVAEVQENLDSELEMAGHSQQSIASCLQALDIFLRQEEIIVSSMVVAQKTLLSCDDVVDVILNILGIADQEKSNPHSTFAELGMDSITSVEIKQVLEREHELFLTSQDIRSLTVAKLQELIKTKGENQKIDESYEEHKNFFKNMKLLLDHMHVDGSSLKEADVARSDSSKIYVLPGLEGTVTLMKPLMENLNVSASCVQYNLETAPHTIEEWAESILPTINVNCDTFVLVAHSFGCVVATELAFLLEKSGRRGKLVFIDGAPNMLMGIYRRLFGSEGEESWDINVVCMYMMVHLPKYTVLKHKNEMSKCTSLEDRVKLYLNILPKSDRSDQFLFDLSVQCCRKLRAMLSYSPKFPKLKSRVKLLKPKQAVISGLSEDYGLSSLFENVERVEEFDGEHLSVVKNPELARAIDVFIRSDDDVAL